jgi:hypothetical protein
MLAQLEKTLNVFFVRLVRRMRLIGENVNVGHLTNHLEDPRGILTTLVSEHGAHNDLLLNEVKYTEVLFPRCHLHTYILGNVGDVVVVTNLRSESIEKKLVQHPIDRLHPMSSTKLHLAIHGVIHESHLTIYDIPTQGLIGLIRILIPISCNFFSGSPSLKLPKLSVFGLERWVTD